MARYFNPTAQSAIRVSQWSVNLNLETRPRHPHPERSQSGMQEVAVASLRCSKQVWQYIPCFAQVAFRERGCVRRLFWPHVDRSSPSSNVSDKAGSGFDYA